MFRSFAMTGQSGEIKRGAVSAASLGNWSLRSGSAPDTWAFTAQVTKVDAFHITQSPDVLVLIAGKSRWRWRGVSLEIRDGNVAATLTDRPEEL